MIINRHRLYCNLILLYDSLDRITPEDAYRVLLKLREKHNIEKEDEKREEFLRILVKKVEDGFFGTRRERRLIVKR